MSVNDANNDAIVIEDYIRPNVVDTTIEPPPSHDVSPDDDAKTVSNDLFKKLTDPSR